MALKSAHIPKEANLIPSIKVIGVGGAGCNSVNNMLAKGLEGSELIVANTDSQSLAVSAVPHKIQLGVKTTGGLGAGTDPVVGRMAAEETLDEIVEAVGDAHLCFVTAGMGGGTGTGAGPIIARAASEAGAMTVGVVTKPFFFEGSKRMKVAEEGLIELQAALHSLIVIPNQNLFQIANERTTTKEAFSRADDVLYLGVKSVIDLILRPGLINLDFADLRAVLSRSGRALIGCGEATGEDRGIFAAELAMNNPLLEETSLSEAKGVLVNIIGGEDMTLFDLNDASDTVRKHVSADANLVFGSTEDSDCGGKIRVSVIATGLNSMEFSFTENAESAEMSARDHFQDGPSSIETEDEFEFPDNYEQFESDFEMQSDPGFSESDEAKFASQYQSDEEVRLNMQSNGTDDTFVNDAVATDSEDEEEQRPSMYVAPQRRSASSGNERPENEMVTGKGRSWSNRLSNVKRRLALPTEGQFPEAEARNAPVLNHPSEAGGYDQKEEFDYNSKVPAFLRRQAN